MKIPLSWLREYVRVDATTAEIAEAISVGAAEVEGVERVGVPGELGLFRVGHVLEAEKHPDADRLQLTSVDVGEDRPYSIVCGAWNFGAGAKVAVALPGATLPNGLVLERRKLRGQVSEGMILAEDELDLGTDHTGIIVLDDSLEAGTPLADVLPLVDEVLNLDPTGNRPDLFAVYGVAREVAALLGGELLPLPGEEPPRDGKRVASGRRLIEDRDGIDREVGPARVPPRPSAFEQGQSREVAEGLGDVDRAAGGDLREGFEADGRRGGTLPRGVDHPAMIGTDSRSGACRSVDEAGATHWPEHAIWASSSAAAGQVPSMPSRTCRGSASATPRSSGATARSWSARDPCEPA